INVSFTQAAGSRVEQVYEKVLGKHRLRRLSLDSKEAGKWRSAVSYSYPPKPLNNIPIPNRIETLQTIGDLIQSHEVSKIEVKSINQPIPSSQFAIETMGIRPGTAVVGSAIPPALLKQFHHVQWNGKALVPVNNREIMRDSVKGRVAERGVSSILSGKTLLATGLMLLLVVIGIVFVNYRIRASR
ncbi:MAG TPA: hypothetical protein VF447_10020, partial [Terriglobales bacterium]